MTDVAGREHKCDKHTQAIGYILREWSKRFWCTIFSRQCQVSLTLWYQSNLSSTSESILTPRESFSQSRWEYLCLRTLSSKTDVCSLAFTISRTTGWILYRSFPCFLQATVTQRTAESYGTMWRFPNSVGGLHTHLLSQVLWHSLSGSFFARLFWFQADKTKKIIHMPRDLTCMLLDFAWRDICRSILMIRWNLSSYRDFLVIAT